MTRLGQCTAASFGAALFVSFLSFSAAAQSATITGQVVVKGNAIPIGFTVVGLRPAGTEQFTDADGRFVLHDVRPGRVTVSAKHVGYSPLDTTIAVVAGDTVRLQLELALIVVRLPAVHSLAQGCAHPGVSRAQVGLELAVLLEQVQENAERNRLLSRSYPFEITVERRISKPEPALLARFVAYDTVRRSSEREWRYAPGKMIGSREIEGGAFGGRWLTLTVPELADFADEHFLNAHCFDFGGVDVVGGDSLLRVEFIPAPSIREPDISGTIFLDPRTFQLRSTLVALENLNVNKQLRDQVVSQTIRATFTEVVPGVAVLDTVSSVVYPKTDPKKPPTEPATETQRMLSVKFLKRDPRP